MIKRESNTQSGAFGANNLDFWRRFLHLRPLMSTVGGKNESRQAFDLEGYLTGRTAAVNRALNRWLPPPTAKPATIHKAMRYSIFALPLACAVECIHTYSLIHDDLPAMDDDDLRRGKPTSHKVFGEGIAILAGDALLTEAFALAAWFREGRRYSQREVVLELAGAAGSRQLIAGQVADLEGEGKKISARQLRYIHERKTSALLRCAVRLGGMSADCTAAQLAALSDFGHHVGLAFQIIDDILDVTQSSAQLGKTAGKDQAAQKATYPAIVGLERSREIAAQLTGRAFAALESFKGKAPALAALAEYLLKRNR
jgi:geranylgeranyl diphosphate synthase type II